jgi:aminopeptidase N
VLLCGALGTGCSPSPDPVVLATQPELEPIPATVAGTAAATIPTVPATTATTATTTATAPATTSASSVPGPVADDATVRSAGDRRYPRLGSAVIDVGEYRVDLTYDPAGAGSLSGSVTVSATALAATGRIALDAAGLDVTSVHDGEGDELAFSIDDDELLIELAIPRRAGEELSVVVAYSAPVPADEGFADRAGLFEGVDHPGVWAVNEPDGASTWMPVSDHPTDKARWTFAIVTPPDLTAIANGESAGRPEVVSGGGLRWEWEQAEPMAPYLVMLLIGPYTIADGGVSSTGVPLSNVTLSDRAADAAPYADVTDRQLAFFADLFGAYPFDRYGIALADSEAGLAMETQGMSLFSSRDLDGSLGYLQHLLLAHELTHQWFGDAVSPAQWDDIWLNEGWATYGQWLWLEEVGLDSVESAVSKALTQLHGLPSGGPVSDPHELFGSVAYDGGAVVLHALRLTIGDEAFFAGAREWIATHLDSAATTAEFQATMERASGTGLDAFFATWVDAERLPDELPGRLTGQ